MPSVNSEVPVCGNSAPVGARAPVGRRCRLGRRAKTVASRQRLLLRRRRGRGGCVYGAGDAVDDMSSTSRRARKPTTTNRRSRQARSSARGRCARARTQRCQPSEDSSCSQACLWRARSRASLVALGVGEATVRFGHLGPPLPSAAPPGAAPVRPPPQPSALRRLQATGLRPDHGAGRDAICTTAGVSVP